MLVRRKTGGNLWSGRRYVLEDPAGHVLATLVYRKVWETPHTITTDGNEYSCRMRKLTLKLDVSDSTNTKVATVAMLPRKILVADSPALDCINIHVGTTGANRTLSMMRVAGPDNRTAMSLSWTDASRGTPLGSARLGDFELGSYTVLVACLAFHVFSTVGGGG
jgi:hypothetical protein